MLARFKLEQGQVTVINEILGASIAFVLQMENEGLVLSYA